MVEPPVAPDGDVSAVAMTRHYVTMMAPIAFVANIMLLVASDTAAEEPPDFSGHWQLVTSSGVDERAARELDVRRSFGGRLGTLEALTIERYTIDGVQSETLTIGIEGGLVGGMVGGGGASRQTLNTRFSTRWSGDHLIIMHGSYSGPTRDAGPYHEREEEWSMDEAGRLLIVVTERESGVEPKTMQHTYQRR